MKLMMEISPNNKVKCTGLLLVIYFEVSRFNLSPNTNYLDEFFPDFLASSRLMP
jgi:hypothetical protein